MIRLGLCFLLFLAVAPASLVDGLPTSIEITPGNIAKLGFNLEATLDGSKTSVRLYFPPFMHKKWPAWRVQTYLFDSNGKQIAGTSADYQVDSQHPVILTEFNHQTNRLAIVVQYFCQKRNGAPCPGAEAYEIKSVTDYLIKSQTASKGTADGKGKNKPHP